MANVMALVPTGTNTASVGPHRAGYCARGSTVCLNVVNISGTKCMYVVLCTVSVCIDRMFHDFRA